MEKESGTQKTSLASFKLLVNQFTPESNNENKVIQVKETKINRVETNKPYPKTKPKKERANYLDTIYLEPLTDILKDDLDILFIGINPGAQSSLRNRHFANPNNAFWPCLYESGLINEKLTCEDDVTLPEKYNYGFTNLAARPSRSSSQLTRNEIKEGVPILKEKITKYRPLIACFLGKQIYEHYSGLKNITLGLQGSVIEHNLEDSSLEQLNGNSKFTKKTYFYAMPSTSGRAATFSRKEKIDFFKDVKRTLGLLKDGQDPISNA